MAHYIKRYPSEESVKFLESIGLYHVAGISPKDSFWTSPTSFGKVTWTFPLKNSPCNVQELVLMVYKQGCEAGRCGERHRIADLINEKVRGLILPKEELNFDPRNQEY